jgi:hypothetical protein
VTIANIFLLLVIFQIKHFLSDYPLQTQFMLGKSKEKLLWVAPLLAHTGVHGLFTLVISLFFAPWYLSLLLALIDMTIHFFMDRIKAAPRLLGKFKVLSANEFTDMHLDQEEFDKTAMAAIANPLSPLEETLKAVHDRSEFIDECKTAKRHNKLFWVALGFDQMIHHLTSILIIYILVRYYVG